MSRTEETKSKITYLFFNESLLKSEYPSKGAAEYEKRIQPKRSYL